MGTTLTPEELLKPRYRVIADYPNNTGKVNDIISFEPINHPAQWIAFYGLTAVTVKMLDKYPHLFQKLEWWEERKPEEMPKYLRFDEEENEIVKVISYHDGDVVVVERENDYGTEFTMGFYEVVLSPATESDYTSYKSTQKVK